MKKRGKWRSLSVALILCMVLTSIPAVAFATSEDAVPTENETETEEMQIPAKDAEDVTEDDVILEESSENVTVFDLGNSYRAKVFSAYPVRFENEDGDMVDVEPELVSVSGKETSQGVSLSGYAYENKSGLFKQYIPKNLSENTPVIMEYEDYSITMTPTGWLNGLLNKNKHPERKNEENINIYGEKEKKKVTAVYDAESKEATLEYTSLHDGVKESIILNEKPKKNKFSYKLTLKGLQAEVNQENGGINFCDEKTGELIATIEAPFMNDATGNAYSDKITCELKQHGNSDNYTLTLTVDEDYLNDEEREYPVTIDPTATWLGPDAVRDAYIISTYPTSNFYSSGTKIMPSGLGSTGKHRTCINFQYIKSELIDCNISSAKFDIYETGKGNSGAVVRVYKILENWSYNTVTWNTCPDFGTATSYLDYNNSTGTLNKKMTFDVTDWVSDIAEGGSNYGLMLKNQVEASISYTEFYGSRTGAESYRPKLTVVYTVDKPTTATEVTSSKEAYGAGESIKVSWKGIYANNLDHMEYRIASCDKNGVEINENYVPYTKLSSSATASSGSVTIPNGSKLSAGIYNIYIRGVSATGINGTGNHCQIKISRDIPTTPSVYALKDSYSEGNSVTVHWDGLFADNLKEVQYRIARYNEEWVETEFNYVEYTKLPVTPASSGTAVIPDSDLLEEGNYKIFIRGISGDGVRGTGKGANVVILGNEDPTVETLSVTVGGVSAGNGAYVKPGYVNVRADRIRDDAPIKASNLSYSLQGPEGSQFETLEYCTVSPNSDGSFYVTFSVPQSYISKSGRYALYFWVEDDFGGLDYISQEFIVDTDNPTGKIYISEEHTGTAINKVTAKANIVTSVSDATSKVASRSLTLYRGSAENPGAFVEELLTAGGSSTLVNFDAEGYDDGNYCLKLVVTDSVGNTTTTWKDFTIDKPLKKPNGTVSVKNSNSELEVSWEYPDEVSDLDHIRYRMDGKGVWTDVAISGKLNGKFTVPLESGMEGTHYIQICGVDADNTPGEIKEIHFNMDTEPPVVEIHSVYHGIINGTVTDKQLLNWTVSVKLRDDETAPYIVTASGKKSVSRNRIALTGLADEQFAKDNWYIVKLEAEDVSGNKAEATCEVYKGEDDGFADIIPSQHRIIRSLGQNMQLPHFIISSTENELKMKDGSLFTAGKWFVDGVMVSEEKTYETDFSVYEEGKPYKISAVGMDSAGEIYYSNDVYLNDAEMNFTFPNTEQAQTEITLPLTLSYVGFTLQSDTAENINWYAKVSGGEYQQITPGEFNHVLNLDNQQIATDAVSIKAEAIDGKLPEDLSFTLKLASMEEETFSVSSAESYWPENITAQDKINYKTYVRWDTPEVMPEGLSYEVYRSSLENFVPGEATLTATDVTDGYWCDINTNYGISLYYKVRAVIKDSNGKVISTSSFSDLAESTPIDRNEYKKALGHKEYWAYADIATPAGNGYIEKSGGNFLYEQNDAEIANEQLAVALTRTYNSMATGKSSFGYGWTHNYDIELLRLGKDSNLDEGILVLRDGSGTLYQFKAEGDTYISSLGKYVNLKKEEKKEVIALRNLNASAEEQVISVEVSSAYTMTTRDNLTYYFDNSGKLVWMEESNGNLLLFHYDEKRGLLDRVTTGNNISVEFTYNESDGGNDALTIHDMTLPDGQKVVYHYDKSMLTGVTKYPAGEASGGINYSYSYSNRKMTSLTDGMSNVYRIQYDTAVGKEGKAERFYYPTAGGSAESIRVTQNQEENSTLTEKLVGETVVKQEKDSFDAQGQCIEHTDYDGAEEKTTRYEYMDSLLSREVQQVTASSVNRSEHGGSIIFSTEEKAKNYEYSDEEVVREEYDDDKAIQAYYRYTNKDEWNSYLPSEYTEETEGIGTTADEEYKYDAYGNLLQLKDNLAGTVTDYTYYTGAEHSAKGALKSEAEYLISDGTCISSTEIDVQMLPDGGKKETTETVSSGNKTVSEVIYDVMGRELSSVTYTYTAFGTSKQKISKEKNIFAYDGFGRVTEITTTTSKTDSSLQDIAGTVNTTTQTKNYDANGTLLSETGADGITTSYRYDALNRVTQTTRSGGGLSQVTATAYSYSNVSVNQGKDALKNYASAFVTTETIDGLTTNVTYQDGMGRTVRQESEGAVTDYSYDLQGNTITEYVKTGADSGILTLHAYDSDGNETATLQNPLWDSSSGGYVLGDETICETGTYDKAGNLTESTDGNGNKTSYSYDTQGRLISVTPSGVGATSYAYTEAGEDNRYRSYITRTAVNGAVSVETTDADGNLISTEDRAGTDTIETTAVYDAFGNMQEEKHESGNKISYTYDTKDRVSEKKQYSADGAVKYKTVYTYYDNDLVKEMYDYQVNDGSDKLYHYVYYTYDGLKRVKTEAEVNDSSIPSDLSAYTTTYTYNLKDQITAVTYGSATGSEVSGLSYSYNGSRLSDICVKVGGSTYLAKAYTYNPDGSVAKVKDYPNFRSGDRENVITLSYDYDALGRVSAMTYTDKENTVIEKHTYSYDKNGNIVKESNLNTLDDTDEVRYYTYDGRNQLKESDVKDIVTTTEKVEGEADANGEPQYIDKITIEEVSKLNTKYTYDDMGNRIKKTENGKAVNYTYNGLNQLLTESGNGTNLTYTYDDDGNQSKVTGTAGGKNVTRTYAYTPENMLKTYTEGTKSQQNLYNGDGQRVQKKEGTEITNYFYQNGSVLRTNDGNGNLKTFNLLNISDAFGTSRKNGNTEDYYMYTEDFRGSTINVLDKNIEQVVSYTYDDFGNVTENKGAGYSTFINEIQYTGAISDALTGLLYLNARFYEPRTGRFISRDSYRGEKDNADTWHLYLYCANNPINYVDPSGHRKYKTFSAAWVGFGLDVAFTVLSGPVKLGYDVVGSALEYYAKRKGFKLFYNKLMYQAVPKMKGFCNKFFTKIRKAVWRTTGILMSNAVSALCNSGINAAVSIISTAVRRNNASKIIEMASRLSSFGGMIAFVLDYATDRKINGRIRV